MRIKIYQGRPCMRCGATERWRGNRHCVACHRTRLSLWRKKVNPNARDRRIAFQLIAEAHGKGCHFRIHPNMPDELKKRKCWGRLWIEHPNGGGSKDTPSRVLMWEIKKGKRNPKDFLLLCQLHQCWNSGYLGGLR